MLTWSIPCFGPGSPDQAESRSLWLTKKTKFNEQSLLRRLGSHCALRPPSRPMWLASQCKVYIAFSCSYLPLPFILTMATYSPLRSRPRGTSASVDVRAQRRRAVVIDNGLLIPSTRFDARPNDLEDSAATTSPSPLSEKGTLNGVTYISISRRDLDGLMMSGQLPRPDASEVASHSGRIPPRSRAVRHSTPVVSSSSTATLADLNTINQTCGSPNHSLAVTLVDNMSLVEPIGPLNHEQRPTRQDRQDRRGSVSNGRWVLDPRTGFEMYVPPASPRRRLRPRLRSMPAPTDEDPAPLLPERRVLKRNRTEEREDSTQTIRRRRPSQPPPLPPRPACPIPPSLVPFVAAINAAAGSATTPVEEIGNYPPASAPAAEVLPTSVPLAEIRADKQERQFQALIARDCPEEDLTSGPLSPTSSSFKSSLRKSSGAGGKWSAGLSLGIPAFFRARRNTAAGMPEKTQIVSAPIY